MALPTPLSPTLILPHYASTCTASQQQDCDREPYAVGSHPIIGLGAFLVENGVLEKNPAKALTMPKKDAAKRLLVTDTEVLQLLAACERQRNPRQVALSRALLSVLVYAGLRREELLSLHVTDVDFSEGSVLVRNGKGGKSRVVYVCEDCLNQV
jgi:site-specific recombinase XerD